MRVAKAIKRGAIVLVAHTSLVLTNVGASWAVERHRPSEPSAKNFERAMAALVDEKGRDYSMYYAGFRSKPPELCVSLPLYPEPDARSKVSHPLAWHLDFREGQHNAARSSQLKQLDALNGAGLLSKVDVTVTGDAARRFTRYRLTSKGWAASNWNYRTPCLVFEYQHIPLINGFERKQVTGLGMK